MKRRLSLVLAAVLAFGLVSLAAAQQQDQDQSKPAPNPLVQLLQSKGVLTSQEAAAINQATTPAEQQQRLSQLLYSKGIITQDEYNKTAAAEAKVQAKPAPDQGSWVPTAAHVSAGEPGPDPAMAMPPQAPTAPAVIPAVAPIRVLTSEPPKTGGLIPDVKLGSGAKLKFYGFFKSTSAYDTSNQYNDGFPLPGLGLVNATYPTDVTAGLGTTSTVLTIPGVGNLDSGPNGSPTWYQKASATRVGANFEWPDIAGANNTLTGRLEGDFEGNFSRAQNRNVSSLRTRMFVLRLAYGRLDHKFSDSTTGFILVGMDWAPFGSSVQPNLLETEGGAAYFGSLYTREAQIRLGLWHNFGGSRNFTIGIEPTIAQNGTGNNSSDLGEQLGVSERQGTDAARPEVSGRMILQWQLDKARGVAPAQIVFSGMESKRVELVNRAAIANVFCAAGVTAAPGALSNCATFTGGLTAADHTTVVDDLLRQFPRGAQFSSQRWGGAVGVQLPTRWVTLVGQYYTGADLKWYFAGQIFSAFSDTRGFGGVGGLFNLPPGLASGTRGLCGVGGANCPFAFDIDASPVNPVFGFLADGTPVAVPQKPARTSGGFAQLSFPLSRIFNANPAGHNAGWIVAFTAGVDEAKRRDVLASVAGVTPLTANGTPVNSNGTRDRSGYYAGTLTWKFNQFLSWTVEESNYYTRSTCAGSGVDTTTPIPTCVGTIFESLHARAWHDFRSEFGPIFTF